MQDARPPLTPSTIPNSRSYMAAVVGFLAIVGMWFHFYYTNLRVSHDPTSEANLAAAKQKAEPLADALEKYRAEKGRYPTSLDQLTPAFIPALEQLRAFRYSAHRYDWILKSDACVARGKALDGLTLTEVKQHRKDVRDFKEQCVDGYRYYQLQSPNFPQDAQNLYTERWAYYDSSNRQWTLGWCTHGPNRGPTTGMNGVCPLIERRSPDPW